MKGLGALLLIVSFLFSCKKGEQTLPAEVMNVGKDHWINDVLFLNDSLGLAVGGVKTVEGWVYRTTDGGKNWTAASLGNPNSLSALAQDPSGSIWAGGELLYLYLSDDLGENWSFKWLQDMQPTHLADRPMIRDFGFLGPDEVWFVGGENYNAGVIYHSTDGGEEWEFSKWEYQFNDWSSSGDFMAIAGHGLVLSSEGGGGWNTILDNDNFTGVQVYADGRMVVVTQDGNIFLRAHVDEEFEKVSKDSAWLTGYSSLVESEGALVAVGYRGRVSVSEDQGASWQHYFLPDYPDLFSLSVYQGQYYCGSDQGRIYRFTLP